MNGPTDTTQAPTARATRREWIGLAVLALPCLLYAMDLTVLNLAIPQLTADLRPSNTELLWIVDIYGFLVAGSLITMGTLGDRIGRRKLLMIGAVAFGAASIFAAFAQSAAMLIAARAMLGIAGATIAPSTLSLISNMFYDERQRGTAVGIWVASFSAGGALGPVFGGLLLDALWWGSVFLLAVPVMVLLLVLGPRLLPEFRDDKAGRIDLRSAALSITAVLGMIYGAKRLTADGPSMVAFAAIAAAIAIGIMFVRRQLRLEHPLLDLALFRHRPFVLSLAIYVLGAFAAFGMFLSVAQYLQLVLGLGPLEAGLWTAPSGLAFIAGSLVSPLLARRIAKVYVIAGGLVLGAAGIGVLALLDSDSSVLQVVAGYVTFGLGLSFTFALAVDVVVASAPPERAGSASALAETGAELGGAVGIAILGSIINIIYSSAMADTAAPAAAKQTIGVAVATAEQLHGDARSQLLDIARDAFSRGMSVTSVICAVALVVAAVAAVRFLPARAT